MRSQLTAGLMIAAASAAVMTGLAATPKNALGAIAVSPDGATVVAAGDNRVLYVLDPATLEVKNRVYLGVNPYDAFFSKDGATLALVDTDGNVHLLSSADWSEKTKITGGTVVALSAGADTFATLSYATSEGDAYKTPLTVYAIGDGSKKLEASIAGQATALVAAADGSGYAVMLERKEDAAEKKEDVPADVTDEAAKAEFEQKHDGYTTEIVMLDGTGKETARVTSWYSTYDTMVGSYEGGTAYFIGYSNDNLKIAADGTASMFKLPPSYLYGIGVGPDGKKIAAGSLRDGTVYDLAAGTGSTYELDNQEGWPEYFEGFGFAPDGSVYGGTTAYRLAHIGADGTIIAAKPVY
ncbi:hypothetical protein sos41_17730 [Alphaproteobacteria bacterium SO-S41]|nr:hypothetical protein sos41_17730 [Alphaproteobacteria bacterium SO-S41]